ncbi:MAG: hypothetical protein AAFX02_01610 [Pseudomonadota bacterium]
MGFDDPKAQRNCYLQLKGADGLADQFREAFPFWGEQSLEELELPPGSYYPRMARPFAIDPNSVFAFPQEGLYREQVASSIGQILSLLSQISDLCRVIEPVPENLGAYGHAIRECILIASMEVESHCKAVLRANGFEKSKLSTRDYHLVSTPMKLREYGLRFNRYPMLGSLAPFAGWEAEKPTQSLKFYNAYNLIKHDRENCFQEATLENAFEAVAACVILVVAQFGMVETFRMNRGLVDAVSFKNRPKWTTAQCYSSERSGAIPVQYSFEN